MSVVREPRMRQMQTSQPTTATTANRPAWHETSRNSPAFPKPASRFCAGSKNKRARVVPGAQRDKTEVSEPLDLLIADVAARLHTLRIPLAPRARNPAFRIYRDVRFPQISGRLIRGLARPFIEPVRFRKQSRALPAPRVRSRSRPTHRQPPYDGNQSTPYPRISSAIRASRTGKAAHSAPIRSISSASPDRRERRVRARRSRKATITASVSPSPVSCASSRANRSASGCLRHNAMSII